MSIIIFFSMQHDQLLVLEKTPGLMRCDIVDWIQRNVQLLCATYTHCSLVPKLKFIVSTCDTMSISRYHLDLHSLNLRNCVSSRMEIAYIFLDKLFFKCSTVSINIQTRILSWFIGQNHWSAAQSSLSNAPGESIKWSVYQWTLHTWFHLW